MHSNSKKLLADAAWACMLQGQEIEARRSQGSWPIVIVQLLILPKLLQLDSVIFAFGFGFTKLGIPQMIIF